jgi:hypothetical protein
MRVDDTHWNINKESYVIRVDGPTGPEHVGLLIKPRMVCLMTVQRDRNMLQY